MKKFLLIFIFLTSCTPIPVTARHTENPSPTPTLIPSSTPTVTPTATRTATPSPTATPISTHFAIPTDLPADAAPQALQAGVKKSHTTPNPLFYTVQPGDTLAQIADKFGLNIYDLARANNLTDINLIFAGQSLLISDPGTAGTPSPTVTEGKQIVVILSTQRTYAYEDGILLKEFVVSTGILAYPTVIGEYEIYVKYEVTPMTGPGYHIPDVPWVMYFYKGYGFHGAYWHNDFGTPKSHGCVNMKVEEAKWLYNWAPLGTPVLILP